MTAAITWLQSAERSVRPAEGPDGELLTVTRTGRAWRPAVSGPDGRIR